MRPQLICVMLSLVVAASLSMPAQTTPATGVANRIVVAKAARTLTLFSLNRVLKTYKVALGTNPVGPKEREGDGRTPEGAYVIDWRTRTSSYHWALHISYPNADDRRRAKRLGVSPGGAILIHGLPNGSGAIGKAHLRHDWTLGCIAVTDEEIEEIWRLVPNGDRAHSVMAHLEARPANLWFAPDRSWW